MSRLRIDVEVLTDEQIDAALDQMAHLLGPDFVESCEAEIIKEKDIGKRRSTGTEPPAHRPGTGARVRPDAG